MTGNRLKLLLTLLFSAASADAGERTAIDPLYWLETANSSLRSALSPANPCSRSEPLSWPLQPCVEAHRLFQKYAGLNSDSEKELLDESLVSAINQCETARLKRCHPSSGNPISTDELTRFWNQWVKDETYRMNTPEVSCYDRAYILANSLVRLGFRVNLVKIEEAPTLIAVNKDRDGKRTGFFNDYQGTHYVVAIDVVNHSGASERKLLDPQFFDSPVSQKSYFTRTIGQDCEELDDKGTRQGPRRPWGCTFRTLQPNYWVNAGDVRIEDYPFTQSEENESCGWSQLHRSRNTVAYINKMFKFTTSTPIPEALVKSENLNRDLILQGYEQRLEEAKNEYFRYRESAKTLPHDSVVMWVGPKEIPIYLRDQLERYKALVESYPAVILQVRENLKEDSR